MPVPTSPTNVPPIAAFSSLIADSSIVSGWATWRATWRRDRDFQLAELGRPPVPLLRLTQCRDRRHGRPDVQIPSDQRFPYRTARRSRTAEVMAPDRGANSHPPGGFRDRSY